MKARVLIAMVCLLIGGNVVVARSLSEILGGDKTLTDIFVNPLGIKNVMDIPDMETLKTEADGLGLRYKVLDMGSYGTVMSVTPEKTEIAGVPVDRIMIMMSKGMRGLIIQSAACDNCQDMSDYLSKELVPYSKLVDSAAVGGCENVQMLSEEYGVMTGISGNSNMAVAMLMDMTNLMDFLSLYSASPATEE